MVKRLISLNKNTSSLWLGPRQSGKSTLIRQGLAGENHWEVNLLESDTYARYLKDPAQFRKDAEYQITAKQVKFVFIDEIQKIPALTNEVHHLIEKHHTRFILSGSSARKLKRGNTNLLGGRAITQYLFPLTSEELGEKFKLEDVLQHGSLAGMAFDPADLRVQKLRAYVDTYLKEEIAQEGHVRNFDVFLRFLDVAAAHAGDILNCANIAREAGTSLKTIQNYFSILCETLLAFELPAWDKSVRRQLSKHAKLYFSDNGISNAITRQLRDPPTPQQRGYWFEQWLINEVRARLSYQGSESLLYFWRTERGEFEVDLIIAKQRTPAVAIEIKGKKRIQAADLSGLLEFRKEHPTCKLFCVSETEVPYAEGPVTVIPAQQFLAEIKAMGI